MKRLIALSSISLLIPISVVAQQFTNDDNTAQMQMGNDVYVVGNILSIPNDVEDDLFFAGNHVNIKANVGGDVHGIGSYVTIDGSIEDDLRILAGDVMINGTIGGDLLVAGGTVYIGPNAVIDGNLLLGGGDVRVEGIVRGNAKIAGDTIMYLGTTTGTMDIRGTKVTMRGTVGDSAIVAANTLTIDPATTIGGDLAYWSSAGESDWEAIVTGTVNFDPSLERTSASPKARPAGFIAALLGAVSLFALFSAALTIGVFQFATKKFFIDCAARLRSSPGMSALWGLIYFLLTPIIILLLMVTIIGIPLGLAVTACYFLSLLFAQVLAAIVLARMAEKQWATKKKPWHPVAIFFAALGIWILMKLLWVIPVLGWLIVVLTVFTVYGAVLSVKVERYKKVM